MAPSNQRSIAVHWFRRDLRLEDNHGLYEALRSGLPVLPVFIFDDNILRKLQDKDDRRVDFIHRTLTELKSELESLGSSLLVIHGEPKDVWKRITDQYTVSAVYANHDHEPYAKSRDTEITELLNEQGISFSTFKDISIFERDEVLKDDGDPYTVYTPFSRKWKSAFSIELTEAYASGSHGENYLKVEPLQMPSLEDIGFKRTDLDIPPKQVSAEFLDQYHKTRDIPAIDGTSRLSVHLRFGTISIRQLVHQAHEQNEKFLNELIWREFYMFIMWHFPHVVDKAFRPKYDHIKWEYDDELFDAWCKGETGYPLIDAGMRELLATGFMHNRVRMVTASFLTKHLLHDWRLGEAHFARYLLDYELSSNNGGWQWASGSGCDAAPYFRVFNPELQLKKFDPNEEYVRYWAPEYGNDSFPKPIVEHKYARNRAIERYKSVLKTDN